MPENDTVRTHADPVLAHKVGEKIPIRRKSGKYMAGIALAVVSALVVLWLAIGMAVPDRADELDNPPASESDG